MPSIGERTSNLAVILGLSLSKDAITINDILGTSRYYTALEMVFGVLCGSI